MTLYKRSSVDIGIVLPTRPSVLSLPQILGLEPTAPGYLCILLRPLLALDPDGEAGLGKEEGAGVLLGHLLGPSFGFGDTIFGSTGTCSGQ